MGLACSHGGPGTSTSHPHCSRATTCSAAHEMFSAAVAPLSYRTSQRVRGRATAREVVCPAAA
eukprot:677438-Pyramimonas_sp.AAC.1